MERSRLLEVLRYDPESGALTWLPRPAAHSFNSRYAGKPAFTYSTEKGYLTGRVDRQLLRAHRVAFCIMTGRWPEQVDHVNGNPSDNRWANLREVGDYEQARNKKLNCRNKSGVPGVLFYANGWQVTCANRYVGRFSSKAAAISARRAAERAENFHPNHGAR